MAARGCGRGLPRMKADRARTRSMQDGLESTSSVIGFYSTIWRAFVLPRNDVFILNWPKCREETGSRIARPSHEVHLPWPFISPSSSRQ